MCEYHIHVCLIDVQCTVCVRVGVESIIISSCWWVVEKRILGVVAAIGKLFYSVSCVCVGLYMCIIDKQSMVEKEEAEGEGGPMEEEVKWRGKPGGQLWGGSVGGVGTGSSVVCLCLVV